MDTFKTPQNVGVTELEHLLVYLKHHKIFVDECKCLVSVCVLCIRALLQLLNKTRKKL